MEKNHCDFCGAEIPVEETFVVSIHHDKGDVELLNRDACVKCEKKIVRALDAVGKK